MIRYHSFYPWHREGAYRHFMNEEDEADLKAVLAFNREFRLRGLSSYAHSLLSLRPVLQIRRASFSVRAQAILPEPHQPVLPRRGCVVVAVVSQIKA